MGYYETSTPVITSTEVINGVVGQPYSYDVDATGNPVPTYALTVSPDMTMAIDPNYRFDFMDSMTSGSFGVTVEASNGVNPPATQSFTIRRN